MLSTFQICIDSGTFRLRRQLYSGDLYLSRFKLLLRVFWNLQLRCGRTCYIFCCELFTLILFLNSYNLLVLVWQILIQYICQFVRFHGLVISMRVSSFYLPYLFILWILLLHHRNIYDSLFPRLRVITLSETVGIILQNWWVTDRVRTRCVVIDSK